MELVDRLLARISADHPARARVEEAGLLLSVALEDFAKAAITAAHRERKAAARRLRIFVTLAQAPTTTLAQIVDAYAALREHHELVPWRAVNDVLEGIYGAEGEQEVKRLATVTLKAKKREPTPPLASWRRPRGRGRVIAPVLPGHAGRDAG